MSSSTRSAGAATSATSRRYADAYLVAHAIAGVGTIIKIIGLIAGGIMAIASFGAADKGGLGPVILFVGLAFAGMVAATAYILGTLASAHGQVLMATLDVAVNSSHFLTNQDRARIMSLPYDAAESRPGIEWRCRCGQKNPPDAGACLECGVAYGG